MLEKRSLTCIVCPMGCSLEAALEGGEVVSVSGNTCPRGEAYAREECIHPSRVLTTTVKVAGGERSVAPVKTAKPVPKALLFPIMEEIRRLVVPAPVKAGQILAENLCGTGAALMATAAIRKDWGQL